jgi:hypothetical protein
VPNLGAVDRALGLAPGTMAAQATHNHQQEIERTLGEHLAGHNPVQWLRTVLNLQRQLDERLADDGDPRVWQLCSTTSKHGTHAWPRAEGERLTMCPGRYV